jgi:hypothetical protein
VKPKQWTKQDPVQVACMALAKEKRDRAANLQVLSQRGVILIETYADFTRVRVGACVVEDKVKDYPSVGLFARVQLAIAAGQREPRKIYNEWNLSVPLPPVDQMFNLELIKKWHDELQKNFQMFDDYRDGKKVEK